MFFFQVYPWSRRHVGLEKISPGVVAAVAELPGRQFRFVSMSSWTFFKFIIFKLKYYLKIRVWFRGFELESPEW